LAQGNQQKPSIFNLLIVYNPASGGNGVKIPVLVEQFKDLSLANVTQFIGSKSQLVTVKSFDEQPNASLSAYDLMHFDADAAVPEITLSGLYKEIKTTWTPEPDLLADSSTDTHFVAEVEFDGSAHLRFGDGTNGRRPESATIFTASYRIGNGTAGNVGAESLKFLAADPRIQSCINPLPATGGTDPETTDQIRRRAPLAFLTQERAITMADYAAIARRNSQVDDAVATLRWTGSWYTVFVTAEPKCAGNLTGSLRKALTRNINRYRLAGQDIQLESPQYVSLEIELTVCVAPEYFRSHVESSLRQVLGNKVLPNGLKGLFYPDSFIFGQTVYLSPIYAAARKVAGIESVTPTVFEPQGIKTRRYLDAGEIPIGPLQVARLENDPSLPDHGRLTLVMQGGK
jgi:predicted phage baseplate assembly protein